jgi:hypothetical protein
LLWDNEINIRGREKIFTLSLCDGVCFVFGVTLEADMKRRRPEAKMCIVSAGIKAATVCLATRDALMEKLLLAHFFSGHRDQDFRSLSQQKSSSRSAQMAN